ncbi:RagB/SusD family nutrient uptake outer membrane protein [Olivibacter ginsenosidimutans]|uniref:RagB/SusD family nutrient uptake outer membrane protein n=1 Tax=Olivibacter ginsenosidimutans TaxID=1176537 RepID=A0ABP9AEB3_9SPHI
MHYLTKFMVMNHINKPLLQYSLILLVFSFILVSCQKELEENPQAVNAEDFYNTAEEVETAVNAIYTPLRITMFPNYIATLECQSDWLYGRGSWDPLSQYQGLNDANVTRVSGFWDVFYRSIRNANLVIQKAPLGTSISVEDVNRFVAEAKFLRAFCYFQLVRNWGGVPLRNENNMLEPNLPKSSVEDVYQFILADLLEAESNLPTTQADGGRPTVWAAKTLLGDVYLQLGQYEQAEAKASEVMATGNFSLVKIANKEDFQQQLYGPDIQTTSEEIFSFKYARLPDQGNYILWISNHPSTKLFSFDGAYAVHGYATNPNYINQDEADIRKQLWDKIDFGLGPNTLVSSKYVDQKAISQTGAGNDQPIYRYAEVLLLYAEANCRIQHAVTTEAMEALNQVHRRAYGLDPKIPSDIDLKLADYTAETFIDRIIQERGYEFVYEGKRWLELKRTGKVDELISYGKGKTVAEKHLLWPIPVSEMNYNKALDPKVDQNPGY